MNKVKIIGNIGASEQLQKLVDEGLVEILEAQEEEGENVISLDSLEGLEIRPRRPRRSYLPYLGFATMMAQAAHAPYIDDIVLSDGPRTKKVDIYRKYEPNPDSQPRNEKCKCGSGKKYKFCCIKK